MGLSFLAFPVDFSFLRGILTFDLTVMEGAGTFPLGAQPSPTREAQRPPQIGLVGALRTRLARLEPVTGEVAHRTLACL